MSMLSVSSTLLDDAASMIGDKPRALSNGVGVTAAQLRTAASILREAEPSRITTATGVRSGSVNFDPQERPGVIDAEQQDDPMVLTFTVGILPAATYRICRDGSVDARP